MKNTILSMPESNVSDNYEYLAEAWAVRLDTPFDTTGRPFELCLQLINALWSGVYPETIENIEVDPVSFAQKVAMYRRFHSEQNDE